MSSSSSLLSLSSETSVPGCVVEQAAAATPEPTPLALVPMAISLQPESETSDSSETRKDNNKKKYFTTSNPHNQANIDLHRNRFRNDKHALAMIPFTAGSQYRWEINESQTRTERLLACGGTQDWQASHLNLKEDMNVCKFVMALDAQRLIYKLQVLLCDRAYNSFGKTAHSWDGYTLMYRNGFQQSGDKRKPTTALFDNYWLEVYCPIIFVLLFGRDGWKDVGQHVVKFKSCTIKVCEETPFYGEPIFHMHIDGKVGIMEEKNHAQRRASRMLFSIVTDALEDYDNADAYKYGTTAYPIWQPKAGFASNHEFHRYMHQRYEDRGLENSGLPRPHYEIPEKLIYRAVPGEVLYHPSHVDKFTPQAIHSEPNPCPDRHLFVFDFVNLVQQEEEAEEVVPAVVKEQDDGDSNSRQAEGADEEVDNYNTKKSKKKNKKNKKKVRGWLPCTRIPEALIFEHLGVLGVLPPAVDGENSNGDSGDVDSSRKKAMGLMHERVQQTHEAAAGLLSAADKYPDGRAIVQGAVEVLTDELRRMNMDFKGNAAEI